jgi:hypothetical protein
MHCILSVTMEVLTAGNIAEIKMLTSKSEKERYLPSYPTSCEHYVL